MKIDPRRVEEFLRAPGPCRVVLLYGDDAGLVRERGGVLVRAVAGTLDDPFRVAELERDGHGLIADEMSSLSLTGGRRVVRVREVGDAVTASVQKVLAGKSEALLVLEAPGLASKSKLRALAEKDPGAAAIGCYPLEGRALGDVVKRTLAEFRVAADGDAVDWLVGQLGADQAITRSELEKLALYAGAGGTVDMDAARVSVGDLAGLSLDDALFAATAGDVAGTDRALELAMAEGAAPVGVLRAALLHIQRLRRVREEMANGSSAGDAAKSARPPIFFRRLPAFTQALNLWSAAALDAAALRLSDAERACKRTGSPAETICRNAVLGLAQRGAAARRR